MQLFLTVKLGVLLRLTMGCYVRFLWQLDNPICSFQSFKDIATPPIYHHQKHKHKRTC
jgi:hypothetical protein